MRGRSEELRCWAISQLGRVGDADPPPPGPTVSPLHDALNAIAMPAHAAIAIACISPGKADP
jgi:hypothetical protein